MIGRKRGTVRAGGPTRNGSRPNERNDRMENYDRVPISNRIEIHRISLCFLSRPLFLLLCLSRKNQKKNWKSQIYESKANER